jgi:hypothetical protein
VRVLPAAGSDANSNLSAKCWGKKSATLSHFADCMWKVYLWIHHVFSRPAISWHAVGSHRPISPGVSPPKRMQAMMTPTVSMYMRCMTSAPMKSAML